MAAETTQGIPGVVGDCVDCDGQMVEVSLSKADVLGYVGLECQECGETGEIVYRMGEDNPWENPSRSEGVENTTIKHISWIDCQRCDGHGEIMDPICDLRRAMNGREHTCPNCRGSGRSPRIHGGEDD